jgi:hypothetical protein
VHKLIKNTFPVKGKILAPRPARIPVVDGVVPDERVEVYPAVQPDRVFRNKAAERGVYVSRPILVELRLGVVFPSRKLQCVGNRSAGISLQVAEGFVPVLIVYDVA